MEQLLKSNFFLLDIVVLLSVAVMGVKMTERTRAALIYIFSFFLTVAGSASLAYVLVGSTIVLFLSLEFITNDRMRVLIFTSFWYKLKDFLYRLFVEMAWGYFIASVACVRVVSAVLGHTGFGQFAAVAIGGLAIFRALFILSSPKYKTADITDIIGLLESKLLIYRARTTPHIRELFGILAAIEDRSYFDRGYTQHIPRVQSFVMKAQTYLAVYGGRDVFRAFVRFFKRGYGTIEMQLLRSIGIEFGYRSTIRRKLFELCYADMIINGYRNYLERGNGGYSREQYREFIIRQYIENVPVKINSTEYRPGEYSTVLQLFRKKSLNAVSKEEFYVWCLGLPYYDAIGPIAVGTHRSVLQDCGIDEAKVLRIVAKLRVVTSEQDRNVLIGHAVTRGLGVAV